jgi:hypothetical protein
MKTRNGLVSNSSSSSFICCICGEMESGYDASPSDFDMTTCKKGHTYHNSCAARFNFKDTSELISKDEINVDDIDSKFCPICQLAFLTDADELKFLRHMYMTTKDESLNKIKETYGTLEKFHTSVSN